MDRVGTTNTEARRIIEALKDMGAWRNCANCSYWQHPHGCILFQAMPPQEILAAGCEKHSDLIPF